MQCCGFSLQKPGLCRFYSSIVALQGTRQLWTISSENSEYTRLEIYVRFQERFEWNSLWRLCLRFFCFFYLVTIICKSKFTLAFKTEHTFKVAVKQQQVVEHPTGNATFALSGKQNLWETGREKDKSLSNVLLITLNTVIISMDHKMYPQNNVTVWQI